LEVLPNYNFRVSGDSNSLRAKKFGNAFFEAPFLRAAWALWRDYSRGAALDEGIVRTFSTSS
jgi:hypothetical protein